MEITINQNENQLISISNEDLHQLNIEQNDNQLITINNSDSQDIDINQNDNQTILIDGGGVAIGITDVLVNGVSVVSGNIAYVTVPTKTSELINNSGFITNETDPTVPSYVKAISLADINKWNNKQDLLVSGTNIKTINNTSILGSGNIDIQGDSSYSAGTGIDITNGVISNTITSYDDLSNLPTIPTQTSELLNDSDFVSENELSEVAFTGSYASLSNTPEIPDATSDLTNDGDGTYPFLLNKSSQYYDGIGTLGGATAQSRNLAYTWDNGVIQESHTIANYDDLTNELATKQDTLVSGTNIKTINNESLLGNSNINVAVPNIDNNFSSNQTIDGDLDIHLMKCRTIEIGGPTQPPYIDFHYNNDYSVDYTSRIIENSSGTLNIIANLNIKGTPILLPYVLYNDTNGTNGNIILSDDIENYEYIKIFYYRYSGGGKTYSSKEFENPSSKVLLLDSMIIDGAFVYLDASRYNGTNTNLNYLNGGWQMNETPTNTLYSYGTNSQIYITKIIGYK